MHQSIIHIALLVRDYDEAITFYTEQLSFTLLEDTAQPEQHKRWVVVFEDLYGNRWDLVDLAPGHPLAGR